MSDRPHGIECDMDGDCACRPAPSVYPLQMPLFESAPARAVTVLPIAKWIAEAVIREHHYSKSCVWSSSVHLGVFFGGSLIGAMQFGPGMNPKSGGGVVEGSGPDEWLELNRMVLMPGRPENCATQAISGALAHIRKAKPKVQWIQSFADSRCGKAGGVYQAASFLYCGSHVSTFYLLDGEWFHKSLVGRAPKDKRGWGRGPKAERLAAGVGRAEKFEFTQFRYIKFLDKRARRRLLLPVLPYPKPHQAEGA